MNWYKHVLTKKYADFTGRARRKEFWFFALFNLIIYLGFNIIINGMASLANSQSALAGVGGIVGLLAFIILLVYALGVLIPGLAVTVRRLHDTDRRGWWIFIAFVPIVGPIILLIFEVLEGTAGENRFGPNPKNVEAEPATETIAA